MWTPGPEILTVAEMNEVDRLVVSSGVTTLTLMENAGRKVANEIAKRWPACKTMVLCGPGNNGGDGFVVARHLQARGYKVEVVTVGDHSTLKPDAAAMAKEWTGPMRRFDPAKPVHSELVVDAVFGAGLSRGLEPELSQLFEDIEMADVPTVAIDVPSGICGDRGAFIDGGQPWTAALTVTFFRRKPAHVLYPSRKHCGEIVCVDIGIPDGILNALSDIATHRRTVSFENVEPPLPKLRDPAAHKYNRGHCVVVSGPASATGAARLAAHSALRVGAGLVTVAGEAAAIPVLSSSLTAIMVRETSMPAALHTLLEDKRYNAVVIGPGNGVGQATRDRVAVALSSLASTVLDADALTSFAETPDALVKLLTPRCVLTPHEGEFERIFPNLLKQSPNKIEAARIAAQRAGAVVLLKGADTVIANPDGTTVVNTNAPPDLATAGSGDVLAGIIGGLLAQGMTPFDAARTGAYLHGLCGRIAGPGLIAEDLADHLPRAVEMAQKPGVSGL
ncbi:MAG: NAD(P)H-hydrate dehydratase [Alphaproteobacteria bacterium]|nr:NAD(P)H-hydrate dehydratase [Alphaproteobacteria bacterium]